MGKLLVKTCTRFVVSGWTIWKVVVPPLMMIASPSSHRFTAARAMARFSAAWMVSCTEKGRALIPTKVGGEMASAPPRTRRSFFWTCSVAISRRIVASDAPVMVQRSGTVTTGRSWTADRMTLWRSVSCMAVSLWPKPSADSNHCQSFSIAEMISAPA